MASTEASKYFAFFIVSKQSSIKVFVSSRGSSSASQDAKDFSVRSIIVLWPEFSS